MVWQTRLDFGNFHRNALRCVGFLADTDMRRPVQAGASPEAMPSTSAPTMGVRPIEMCGDSSMDCHRRCTAPMLLSASRALTAARYGAAILAFLGIRLSVVESAADATAAAGGAISKFVSNCVTLRDSACRRLACR